MLFSFFGGNDFVDPFLHTKMRDHGLDKLFVAYKNALVKHGHLLIDKNLNFDTLVDMLNTVSSTEDVACRKLQSRQFSSVHKSEPVKNVRTKEEQFSYDMQKYEHLYYTNRENPFNSYYRQIINKSTHTCLGNS